jgi:hypothetical protein
MDIRKLFDYSVPLIAAATILGLSIALVGVISGVTAYKIKVAGDTVSVTGSARQEVTSDYARITINIETKTEISNQQSGFDRLEAGAKKIAAALTAQGVTDIEFPAGSSYPQYYYSDKNAPVMTGYNVSRTIIARSANLDVMQNLSNDIAPFVGSGYSVSISGLELTYQKLDEVRVALLSRAIADAKARADAIASESGRKIGVLRNSTSGVVQVLAKGGIDISDYGTYDTQSKEKEIMVTVRATFDLK